MSMTARFAFPLLHAGQAQKEMFHKEAVVAIDALLHPDVRGVGLDVPPVAPEPGDAWIVGTAPTGDWEGHGDAIASWTEGGWRFVAPRPGMEVWAQSVGQTVRYHADDGWQLGVVAASRVEIDGVQVIGPQAPAVALPTGGAIVDEQARTAIVAVLERLQAHGLIASPEL